MVRALKLQSLLVRNEVCDAEALIDFSSFSFQMWPGYKFGIHHTNIAGPSEYFIKIKSVHQVIRLENVLEKLLIIRELSSE